jgi:hypothetical protein
MLSRHSREQVGLFRKVILLVALASIAAPAARAQGVSTVLGPLVPYSDDGKLLKDAKRAADTSGVALYAAAFLGPVANVPGVAPDAQQGVLYESVNFLVSASTLPTLGGADYDVVGNLRRLQTHVTITPLDANQRPLAGGSDLEVLATFPDTVLLNQPTGDSTSTHAGAAAFGAVTRSVLPELAAGEALGRKAGPAIANFLHLYHRPSAQLQVGYVSNQREFGWLWYGRDQQVIDGMHHTSVALEVGPATRFVRVHMRLTAQWRSHGTWTRDIDTVLELPAARP